MKTNILLTVSPNKSAVIVTVNPESEEDQAHVIGALDRACRPFKKLADNEKLIVNWESKEVCSTFLIKQTKIKQALKAVQAVQHEQG